MSKLLSFCALGIIIVLYLGVIKAMSPVDVVFIVVLLAIVGGAADYRRVVKR